MLISFILLQELKQRRVQVVTQLTELQKEVAVILKLLSNEEVMKMIETMRDPKALSNYITKEFDVSVNTELLLDNNLQFVYLTSEDLEIRLLPCIL